MRDVVELGRNVEISAQNQRLRAGACNKTFHFAVPIAPAIKAARASAVGHVNTEKLRAPISKAKKNVWGNDLKVLEFA
jgi:hypothetical protein